MANAKRISWINRRTEDWSRRRNPPAPSVVLNRRNILILPTTQGLLFLLATLVVFLAAVNYENSLAFGLAFFMFSLFIVSLFHGFSNLNGLQLSGLPANPVYCGEDAAFQVRLSRRGKRKVEALELCFRDSPVSKANLVRFDDEQLSVFTRTHRRGLVTAPALTIRSRFPTGLFTAWSVVHLSMQCLVYPRPVAVALSQLISGGSSDSETAVVREGSDDFYGFRSFAPGDSLRQVAWKNVARGQGMLVKQFVDYLDERLMLDWDLFYGFGDEERLSRLCYCVLKLSRSDTSYGLRLPGLEIAPHTGNQHKLAVLQSLALYRQPSQQQGPGRGGRGG